MLHAAKFSFVALLALAAPARAAIEIGAEPADFLGKDAGGNKVLVTEQRGKLVVVSFFASWCGPCRKELPMLAALQKVAGRDKVIVVAVNYKEDTSAVRAMRKIFKDYDLTITHDGNGSIGRKYDVRALPRMVIIGKDGKVAAEHVGYGEATLHKIVDEINRLWREPQPSAERSSK